MKQKLIAFFSHRNGMDSLAKIVFWPSLVLMLISGFVGIFWLQMTLYAVSLVGVFYSYFRIFSRNLEKRRQENGAYVKRRDLAKLRFKQRKTHRFYRCPQCKAFSRVPRGRGRITVICRQCGHRFDKKS